MKIKIVKLLNLIRFRIIGTILLSITITGNTVKATALNVDYKFFYPYINYGRSAINTINSWPSYC